MKVWLYYRLSRDEDEELNSLNNQRKIIYNFAVSNGHQVVGESFDDNVSGMHFNREGIDKIYEVVEAGKIEAIIVKDLSRLGRNYAETGRYLEQIFPRMGIRFVAVNDQYDSAKNTDTVQQMAVFKNVFNDFYAADASAKVRTSLGILKRQGKFLGRQAPYGYRIDPADKYHLLPDEETAPVVRRIFRLFLGGSSRTAIAKQLKKFLPRRHRRA